MKHRVLTIAALLTSLTAPPLAAAQTAAEKSAAAQALFDDGLRLMKEGKTADACPKLEESQRLDPGMGTQFRLAECYEKLGKTTSAWALFGEVAAAAHAAGSDKREAQAQRRADALVPRLSRLAILVPPEVAAMDGLMIERNGLMVGRSSWGTAIPVDPGEHVISAIAPHARYWEKKISVKEGARLEVQIPILQDFTSPAAASPEAAPAAEAPLPAEEGSGRSAAPAIALGGLAAVGVGAGIAFLALRGVTAAEAVELSNQIKSWGGNCVPGGPGRDATCELLADRAATGDRFGTLAIVGFAVGGAAAIGTVTYLLWPSAKPQAAALRVAPMVSGTFGGFMASGSF